LVLPVTGELVGTWGDVANGGLTELVDAAIAGTASVSMTDANYTLTVADGLTDESRKMFVVLTGALTAQRNVVCPSVSKLYFVANTTSGAQSIVFKTNAGTGITVPNGEAMVLYCNGTNVVNAITYFAALKSATLNLTGAATIGGAMTVAGEGDFTSTGAVKIPAGTTAQRPTGAVGKIRWNSSLNQYEGFDGTNWTLLGGAVISNDTSTATNVFPVFAGVTSGNVSTLFTGNARLLYRPSTGELQSSALVASNGLMVNSATVSVNYTIPTGSNAMSTGPISVDSGAVVTVPDGSRWMIL
jgi:hypothetical protein